MDYGTTSYVSVEDGEETGAAKDPKGAVIPDDVAKRKKRFCLDEGHRPGQASRYPADARPGLVRGEGKGVKGVQLLSAHG